MERPAMSPRPISSSTGSHVTNEPSVLHPAAVGPTSSVQRNNVEQIERAYAESNLSPGEASIAAAARGLRSHEAIEFNCKAVVSAEVAAQAEGKIKITRRDDGRFEVQAQGNAAAGLGSDQSQAMIGVGAGTAFVVSTAEGAADLAQAIATVGVTAGSKTNGATSFMTEAADLVSGTTKHALDRLAFYASHLKEMKADIRGVMVTSTSPEAAGLHVHGSIEGRGAGELKVDFERGVVSESIALNVTAEASASLGLGSSALAKSIGKASFDGKLEGKVDMRLEKRHHVSPELLEKVKRGELSPNQLLETVARMKPEYVVMSANEFEAALTGGITGMGKFKIEAEAPIDPKLVTAIAAGDLSGAVAVLKGVEWKGELEGAVGGRVAVEAGLASGELSMMRQTELHHFHGSLGDCLERGLQRLADGASMVRELEARRIKA